MAIKLINLGREIKGVRLYPNEYLPEFRAHFNDLWLLGRAQAYFEKKDPSALPYLQKMLVSLPDVEKNILWEISTNH